VTEKDSGGSVPGTAAERYEPCHQDSGSAVREIGQLSDQELDRFVRQCDPAVRFALLALPSSAHLDQARFMLAQGRIEQRRRKAAASLREANRIAAQLGVAG
jgi:hypothetical protein